MITWLQNFFLKHNKWLFGGLLVVIIVTFVLTIGPQSFFGSGGSQQRQALKYYGYDLNSQADQGALVYTAEISAILHPQLQVRRDQLMDYAYMRAAGLGIANQLGIPAATKDSLADYVETLVIFQDPQTGVFSAEAYQNMLEALQTSTRYDRESVARVIREDYRIAKVREALGGPAYFLPYEMKQDYLDRQTTYDLAIATFPYDSFTPEIDASDEELKQFFNENPARYEIPETISVTALLFTGESYVDEIPAPTETELQPWFEARKSQYAPDNTDPSEEGAAAPEVTLDEVKDTVVADWKLEQARKVAAKKSEQFSLRLWQQSILLGTDKYNSLLEEFSVQSVNVPPYSRDQAPRMGNIPSELLNSMWIYTSNPNRYFSDIAQTNDGAVVLVTSGLTEARMPGFDEVREAVTADYRNAEKRRLFAARGEELRQAIKAGLESSNFVQVATSLGLEVNDLEPFTGAAVPREIQQSNTWDQARYLDKGATTAMVIQQNTGTFVHIQDRIVPEVDNASEEYQTYLAQRTGALNEAMGWSRLREITDQSLNALLGTDIMQ